jgi:hypothetical protein
VEDQRARISAPSGFSPIEELVSMTKLLHNRLLPSPGKRWIFSRIDLRRLLERTDAGNMQVILQQNLNNRVTKSRIVSGGNAIGDIFFSLV